MQMISITQCCLLWSGSLRVRKVFERFRFRLIQERFFVDVAVNILPLRSNIRLLRLLVRSELTRRRV